jgi:hypothetical protein
MFWCVDGTDPDSNFVIDPVLVYLYWLNLACRYVFEVPYLLCFTEVYILKYRLLCLLVTQGRKRKVNPQFLVVKPQVKRPFEMMEDDVKIDHGEILGFS